MIYLFTGSNGSGKTLNSIKFICEELNPNGDRAVFYYAPESQPIGIKEAGVLDWQSIDINTCREWYELPEGSIVLVDEFRHVWPWRSHKDKIPESVDRLAEHRSKGFDFVLTAQKPASQFDPAIQGFIEEHRHLEGVSGSKKSRHFVYQTFCSSPMNPPKLQVPDVSTHSFDKKYFDYYRSASLHTHKDRLPYKKLIPLALAVLLIPALFMFAWSTLTNDEPESDHVAAADFSPMDFYSGISSKPVDDYFEMRTPRVPGLPHTAPIYDEIMEPLIAPKPAACVFFHERHGDCKCWSQQATPIEVSPDFCLNAVKYGWFDDTRDPDKIDQIGDFEVSSRDAYPVRPRSVLLKDTTPRRARALSSAGEAAAAPRRPPIPLDSPKHHNNRNRSF